MKRLTTIVCMFVCLFGSPQTYSAPASADPVRLSFDHVRVVDLAEVVYGEILHENFVLDPELVDSDKLVTLQFQDHLDAPGARKFMNTFLASIGIEVQQKAGYVFLRPLDQEDREEGEQEVFFYRTKYRSVSYITDLAASLFKRGKFTGQRAVKAAQPKPATAQQANAQSNVQPKPVDTGDTAYSVQDKNEADAFIFTGTAKEVALLQKLLLQIDVPAGEVMVKGVVYEVTTTKTEGNAFSLAAAVLGQRLGVNIGTTNGGDSFSITTPNFNAVISALNNDNRFKSVNNASIRVKSGATGVLSVGSDVPVLGGTTVTAGGASQQSINYQSSGVILNLQPTIRDGSIDLVIDEQISSFANTTTGVNNTPTLTKRELQTTVGAANDDVIVIGGLDQDQGNQGGTGASFLPAWMRSTSSDSTKTEVLLILNVHKI